jgi:hypothetical protein
MLKKKGDMKKARENLNNAFRLYRETRNIARADDVKSEPEDLWRRHLTLLYRPAIYQRVSDAVSVGRPRGP